MAIKKGDYVTRDSYNNDTVFKVINIHNGVFYLKGVEVRLYADSPEEDLKILDNVIEEDSLDKIDLKDKLLNRSEYFYLPAKILHIDADCCLSNNSQTPVK